MAARPTTKILVVDDDPNCRNLYRALLVPFGYEILEAGDGKEGLEQALHHKPQLVVTDIVMPTMNGFEFVTALRKCPAMEEVSVVFQSASFLDNQARSLGAACGVSSFIVKPCEPEMILKTVENVLGRKLPTRSVPDSAAGREAIPLLIDAFYEKGQQLGAVSRRFASLLQLGLEVAGHADLDNMLEAACNGARKTIGANYSGVGILSGNGCRLSSFALFGAGPKLALHHEDSAFNGELFSQLIQEKQPRMSFNAFAEPPGLNLPAAHPPIHSFLGVPLKAAEHVYGWIYVADKLGSLEFTPQDSQILSVLAGYVALAYENAQRFKTIAERSRKLEEEVAERRRAEERFRMLVETAPTGIVIGDSQGRIVDVNAHCLSMFGYRREELVGLPVETLLPEKIRRKHEDHRAAFAGNPHARPMGLGIELFARRRDGTEFPVEISLGPLSTRDEILVSASIVDITERKRLEERLQLSQRMEAIGKLAGGVAHDFNNMLTVIMGCCDAMALDLPADYPGMRKMETLKKAATSAADITRQLLAFSRKQILQPQVIEPREVLDGVVKMLRRLIGENIDLAVSVDPAAGKVNADRGQLEQVLINLAANARDAMPNGGKLTIEVSNADLDERYRQLHPPVIPGSYVMIAVTDTGCGMDSKTQSQIFDPFFTTKELGKGTGLGLATVYGIVKQSGGYIWVYSELSRGTVFKVYLPRVMQPVSRFSTLDPVQLAEPPAQHGCETILVAEDSAALREIAEEYLHSLGYKILTAASGREALGISRSFDGAIQLLFTDVIMPEMGGRELADTIAAERPGIRVLFSSGYTDDAIVRHGVLEPGIAFIQKPYMPKLLAQKVREVLGSGFTSDPGSPAGASLNDRISAIG